ncbi:MAG: hypothetical protein JXM70_13075 [Pirellulales bacterium]|nr:hypothetical protein [Pirellulales bacterium]
MLSITVNSYLDNTIADSYTTLREAIIAANANSDLTTIEFDPSVFDGTNDITLSSQLSITEDIEIIGLGDDNVIIDADGNSRVFWILCGEATISGMTITNGRVDVDMEGGAVYVDCDSTLNINNSTISNSRTGSEPGGGIYGEDDTEINIYNSSIIGNTVPWNYGGGIWTDGTLNVVNSLISGNTAIRGGGIYGNPYAEIDLINTTIAGNKASSALSALRIGVD